jgi:transposase
VRFKRDYKPFLGTYLNELRIPFGTWLRRMKLSEIDISARKASFQVNLSCPTTLKGYDKMRRSILQQISEDDDLLKGEIESDESYFVGKRKGKRGHGAGHKEIVFGILMRGLESNSKHYSKCVCGLTHLWDREESTSRIDCLY